MIMGRINLMVLTFVTFSIVVACASTNDKSPASPNDESASQQTLKAEPTSEVASAEAEPKELDILGTWENSSCGTRKYKRVITFLDGLNFEAADLVQPCPPKVTCVWSGVINWRGKYTKKDDQISLNVETEVSQRIETMGGWPAGYIILSGEIGSIAEQSPEGVTCPYHRAP